MFIEGGPCRGKQVTAEQLKLGMLFPPQYELASIKGSGSSDRRCVGVGQGTEADPRLRSPAARPEGAQGEYLSDGLVAALLNRSLLDLGGRGGRADPSERGDLHRRSNVVVVGIADLQNHHPGKGELNLAGALGNHQGPAAW